MMEIRAGMAAWSLAGHDRGKLYIIIRSEGEYVWLADGICHKLENPKKKNRKHIQAAKRMPELVRVVQESGQTLKNEHIIQAILAIQSESH